MACGMRLLRYSYRKRRTQNDREAWPSAAPPTRAAGSISSALAQGLPGLLPKQIGTARTSTPNSFRIIIQHTVFPSYNRGMTRLFIAACLCLAGRPGVDRHAPRRHPLRETHARSGRQRKLRHRRHQRRRPADIVSGENWYEGPRWIKHKFRSLPYTNNYIDNFSDLPLDVNGDGRIDIVSCSWFAHRLFWSENPGPAAGEWKEHMIETGSPVEFAFLVDLDNDGKAQEVLPEFGDTNMPLAWYEVKPELEAQRRVRQARGQPQELGPRHRRGRRERRWPQRHHHPKGWFEAPPDPRTGDWKWHPDFDLGDTGFIYVYDVNGDGRNDIVTSMAHNYGIFWLEQGADGQWTKHIIDESWSQAHALTLVDLNGDGQKDLLTGKRYMAHNGHDPGEREPLGIYWYEFMRLDGGKKIEWVKHVVDYSTRTGGGMQIPVADLDGDGDLDFVVAGKSGLVLV
jgi:hypothetical protein